MMESKYFMMFTFSLLLVACSNSGHGGEMGQVADEQEGQKVKPVVKSKENDQKVQKVQKAQEKPKISNNNLITKRPKTDEEIKLEDNLKKKLASAFVKKGGWTTDFNEARARAKKEGKPIVAYFTRSYADCPPCLKIEGSLLQSKEFEEFAKNKIMYLSVLSYVAFRKHDVLIAAYGFKGFPTVAILSPGGAVVEQLDVMSPTAIQNFQTQYNTVAKNLRETKDFMAKEESEITKKINDSEARAMKDAEKFEVYITRIYKLKKQAKKGDKQAQLDVAVHTALSGESGRTKAQLAKDFYLYFKKGRYTTTRGHKFTFAELAVMGAIDAKDTATAIKALAKMTEFKKIVREDYPEVTEKRIDTYIKSYQEKVDALTSYGPNKKSDKEVDRIK